MKSSSINMSRLRAVMSGALFATGAMSIPAVQADDKAAQAQIPSTSAAIWQSIDHEVADLGRTIESGKLADVHHHAFAIRDLVAALPVHSSSLPADKIAKVKASSKFVATLAARLDASGDANDKAATASNFQKMQELLRSIRGNYDVASSK